MKEYELTELKESKHFCVLPWIHFHAWPDGKVFPCCMADSNKPVSSTSKESIIQMMNTEDFKALRLRMLNDEPSEICTRCYDLETFGTWSLRKSHNTVKLKGSMDLVNATNEDGSIDRFKLKYMDIRFSNICNMKCRSCGPSCSSLWAQEYQDRFSSATLRDRFGLTKIVVSNNEDGSFWSKLEPYLLDVEEVYFAGGEALITPEHYEILDFWLDNGKTDVKVTYTTNLSVFKYKDKNVFDYWKKFPKVEIYASLDGSEGVAEYLRKGTKWNEIESNAMYIKKNLPHVRFEITPTISLWNAWQFPKFHQEWIEKGILTKDQEIRLNILTFPWFASLLILPYTEREQLLRLYEKVYYDESYSSSIRNGYGTVINTLRSAERNKDGIKEFFHFNAKLDEHRKENILDAIPELTRLYEWSHKN
jgi:hypothetical protein